jgi:hypothetical protein
MRCSARIDRMSHFRARRRCLGCSLQPKPIKKLSLIGAVWKKTQSPYFKSIFAKNEKMADGDW